MALDSQAWTLLRQFTASANKSALHAADWRRFYDFVIAVHREHLEAPGEDVKYELLASFHNEERADRLLTVFERGLELLKRHDEQRGA